MIINCILHSLEVTSLSFNSITRHSRSFYRWELHTAQNTAVLVTVSLRKTAFACDDEKKENAVTGWSHTWLPVDTASISVSLEHTAVGQGCNSCTWFPGLSSCPPKTPQPLTTPVREVGEGPKAEWTGSRDPRNVKWGVPDGGHHAALFPYTTFMPTSHF